ncbi:MAG TPA: hypothetical protein VEQ41_04280 [Solirubrobacterales bacterium]|nr:hypothetical protein [Solirubrobacterales bacterium]
MRSTAALLSTAIALAGVSVASAETTHVYPVTLTISVDRQARQIDVSVSSDAPAQFCETSMIRIRRAMPGKDKVIARSFPNDLGEWHLKAPPALRGKRIYAEVSGYRLPERPVECLGARSRTVTAP